MKKSAFIAAVFFVMAAAAFAQPKTDVNMRTSKQDGGLRLVFESEEAFLKKANAAVSGLQLNVEFPSAFNIASRKGIDMDTSIKERIFTVNLKEPFDIKVMRLSSPARFVIDIAPKAVVDSTLRAADIKPQSDVVLAQRIYVIDPGHGGYDSGIAGDDFKEKDIVLSIAREIESLLTKKGKKVFLTRKSDQFMSIKDRAVFANQKMAEIFVSIHVSSGEGFALYVPNISDTGYDPAAALYSLSLRQQRYLQKSRALGDGISKAVKEEFNLNVIRREMPLPILNSAAAPAVLIEIPSFKVMNYDQKTRARLAEAMVKGFSYYGQ
ncbi:MAG: N-acetylmuramoyl-L-alanine amidase [Thermodesulfovibrionales bacterium]|nr:N-acetylmuramoyl-L-alanine amidase [Nitrospinota bacterium]MCG2708937.1 N-acetylmuramoyl-L-alanine amidase [Thermodesulfovibrionales bacterium]MDP3048109.1 N-acetylmuramoyl-L-alanine amidase [Thermodesulfovibrionales bacterium]